MAQASQQMEFLLIHTGGTIGMAPGPDGLAPCPGLLEGALAARLPDATIRAHVLDPLLDSADIGPGHWNQILDLIEAHPGLPVLLSHGTDTMAYSAAALAMALQGSGRSVTLCGAMVPLGQGGDGEANLDLAITDLRQPRPGVRLAFAGRILPGWGLSKHDSHAPDAFVRDCDSPVPVPVRRRFDQRRLGVISLTPGLPSAALEAMLGALDGAVLRVYGAGTLRSDPGIAAALNGARARGMRMRAISQCARGGLEPGSYAAGRALWQAGVENGGTETAECALAQLWLG